MQVHQLQAMRSSCITAYAFVSAPMRQSKSNSHLTMQLEEVSSMVQVLDESGTSACACCGCNRKCGRNKMPVGPVGKKQNPSDLGTNRLNRDRMLYLMFL